MLGQFLEFSVAARPLDASFEFYRSLGFKNVPVGDLLRDPYIGMHDGAVTIGIHERDQPSPALTFVRPQLREYVRGLRRLGIAIEEAHLKDDEFNRVAFVDPSGQPIVLLEARTFGPTDWNPQNVTACGEFFEYTLGTDSLAESRSFWEALGLQAVAAGDAPQPWLRLKGRGLTLGLHETRLRPGLSFRTRELDTRLEFLRAAGLPARAGAPIGDPAQRCATLAAPEGTLLYLFELGNVSG